MVLLCKAATKSSIHEKNMLQCILSYPSHRRPVPQPRCSKEGTIGLTSAVGYDEVHQAQFNDEVVERIGFCRFLEVVVIDSKDGLVLISHSL